MLLTITCKGRHAPDLSYLLHKHPAKCQTFPQSYGQAHVFYPELTDDSCTVALLLDVDPIALVRGRPDQRESGPLSAYVNDRPYVASSFFSVAMGKVFRSAMNGRCKDKPELVDEPLELEAFLPAVACGGGQWVARALFEPLGYEVELEGGLMDETFPEWGNSSIRSLRLKRTCPLKELLSQLYLLIPVMDNNKHYWVGESEVEKLSERGEPWLSDHPQRDLILKRYLRHQRSLVNEANARLMTTEEADPHDDDEKEIRELEAPLRLHAQRLNLVVETLREEGVNSVLDLGCGEGKLLRLLLKEKQFEKIVGMDVSPQVLERGERRLRLHRMSEQQRERISLIQGSLVYRDSRFKGFDGAALVEVIEHVEETRLPALVRTVFEFAQPRVVVVTTPNVEYNVRWESLPAGKMRHRDHRFEWDRETFERWASEVAENNRYHVRFAPVGPEDEEVGAPSQMAVFVKHSQVRIV